MLNVWSVLVVSSIGFGSDLDVADVEIEGREGVSLGAHGAGLVLAGVVGRGLGDLEAVFRGAFHCEPVAFGGLVHWLAVLQPLELEWWLEDKYHH